MNMCVVSKCPKIVRGGINKSIGLTFPFFCSIFRSVTMAPLVAVDL